MERRDFVKTTALAAGGVAVAAGLRPGEASAAAARDGLRPASAGSRVHSGVDPAARELLMEALDAARAAGAQYADARVMLRRDQQVATREEQITNVGENVSLGLGVRALVDGSWGFAATPELTREAAARAAREAAATGRANARIQRAPVTLAPVESYGEVTWTSEYEVDPWDVPIEEKVEHLLALNRTALRERAVRFVNSSLHFVKVEQTTATTEGTVAAQTIIRSNPNLSITAISDDRSDFQTRTSVVEPAGRGWELIRDELTTEGAELWASEAAQKLGATSVEPGRWDLILHPTNLWLTIHESIGHPTELDRALGYEANFAGTSFLAPPEEVIGQARYGPDFMQVEGERTAPGALATVGWDEEGVRTRSWPIVKDGIFVDYQTTREQVAWISALTGEERSHGCAHCDSWSSIPFQRMPNVNLLPAREERSLEDVIGATDRGIYIEGRGSFSIDQQRYNFQFGGQVFWEIRNGRKHRMLKDVAYQATTLDFWNSMDLIGGPSTYIVGGSFYDGKGEPSQSNAVSHGCPVARFRDINILNTGSED